MRDSKAAHSAELKKLDAEKTQREVAHIEMNKANL